MEVVLKKYRFCHMTGDESLPTYSHPSDYGCLYAYTKSIAEKVVLNANNTFVGTDKYGRPMKLMTCALRPVMMYGEGQEKLGLRKILKQTKSLGGVLPKIGWNPKPFQTAYVGNVAWAHIKAMETFQLRPEDVAGKVYFVTDDTSPVPFFEFTEPFLSAFGYRLTNIPIPFTFLYLLLLFVELITWLVKPVYSLRLKSESPNVVETVYYGQVFSRSNLTKYTGYKPCYTPEESFQRTLKYYIENPP